MSGTSSVRERRRAETIREIKAAALEQIAAVGAANLSLRAVAASVGVTVQALYHYFDSRDALLTAMIADGHHELVAAVVSAAKDSAEHSPLDRRLATTGAFRDWALANRALFLLMFGSPVPGFQPPHQKISPESIRLAMPFIETVFAGWSDEELAALPLPEGGHALADVTNPEIPLPPAGAVLLLELRSRMHGLVMLEIAGELEPFNGRGDQLFDVAMRRLSEDVDRLQRSTRGSET